MLKSYLVAKAIAILEAYLAEHWEEIAALGKEGAEMLLALLKEWLGLTPVAVRAELPPLAVGFQEKLQAELGDQLPYIAETVEE